MRIALAVLGSLVVLMMGGACPPISPTNAWAERAPTAAPAAAKVIDIRPKIAKMRLRNGRNTLYGDEHLRLEAVVRRGRIVSIEPVNVSGRVTKFELRQQKGKKKGTRPCIVCYNLDKVLESTCIEVPCSLVWLFKWILRA